MNILRYRMIRLWKMTVEMERKVGEEKVGIFRMSPKILKAKGSISRNFGNQIEDIRLA